MNAPLPFDLPLDQPSFARITPYVAGVDAGLITTSPLRDRPSNVTYVDFVERRRVVATPSDNLIRSPAVLVFVGMLWGLVISSALIIGVSAGLALAGVSWMAAGLYCAAIILLVFGLVGALLYWGTRIEHPYAAGIQRYMEAAVERRRQYLYLSSVNALENARRLGMWERRFEIPRSA